jgi:hypothetical protein
MKKAYKGTLGLMFVLVLVGWLICCDGGDNNFIINPVPGVRTVVGSGNIVQETRSVTGATGVDLRGVANLTIEQGAPEELILQTDDNLMALIVTVVQDGILVIRSDLNVNLQPSQRMEAHLTLNSIDSITLSGVGSIAVPDLMTSQLELTLSGLGDIEISNLDSQILDVLISGVGGISIAAGQVDDQTITLNTFNASGDYDAENLISSTVDVDISGSESATVRVSTTLKANITGSGSVFYHGSPVVTRTGTGTGGVVQLSP